jgi:hypothetical protein
MSQSERPTVIGASELGEFTYCRRGWWLAHVQGQRSTNLAALARGRALHEAHGGRARRMLRLQRVAIVCLLLAVSIIAIGVYLSLGSGGGLR